MVSSISVALLTIALLLVDSSFAQRATGPIARQPAPSNNRNVPKPTPAGSCPQAKFATCLGSLFSLNISALIETFKVYELFSFDDIDESKLQQQAQVTTDTCRAFNTFNDCTGGDFLKCIDKTKIVEIVKAFAGMQASRPGVSSSQMNSMMNEIAAMITDKQIDFAGHALIDACRRIQNGEVRLAELAVCIRKDKRLLDQLGSLAPESTPTSADPSANPLSLSTHCRVIRCDVSRLLIHMLVRAARNCSDESGAKFIFWIGQMALTGIRNAAPDDVVIANGAFGTQTQSDSGDQCIIRDQDFITMKTTPAKTFADLGIDRASQICAAEVATTTPVDVVFRYDPAKPKDNYKVEIEATLDDLHNDLYWENAASQNVYISTSMLLYSLFFVFIFM